MLNREYDCIIPLGGSCALAMQLKRRNLRRFSLGLDWSGNPWDSCYLKVLAEGFKKRFADLCRPENLKPIEVMGHHGMKDTLYGLFFPHDFKIKDGVPLSLNKNCAVVRKRMRRLQTALKKSRKVLFLLVTFVELDKAAVKYFLAVIHELFPLVEVDLRVMWFEAATGPYGEDVGFERVQIFKYARKLTDEQDFCGDSEEWRFMDDLALTERLKTFGQGFWLRRIFGRGRS